MSKKEDIKNIWMVNREREKRNRKRENLKKKGIKSKTCK